MATATKNLSWNFWDLTSASMVKEITYSEETISSAEYFSSCAFHPDGLIIGTGISNGMLKLWDIRVQKIVANLSEHAQKINSISFNENGYLCATGSDDGSCKIWDLRKPACVKTLEGIFFFNKSYFII